MSKRKQKNPNGKIEHQERLAAKHDEGIAKAQDSSFTALPPQQVIGISSPKLVNRPKFQGNIPKMRSLIYRPNQQKFLDTLQLPDTKIVILTGPAGTGKTLLAVRKALEGVLNGRFADMVLCRPLVEAGGEQMGYLPGSVDDKIGPYLEPFYDKLTAFLPDSTLKGLLAAKHITAAPLAFMRGRTFSESVVIIDEAQNTTIEQMKMAVTRLGPFSKMVICGDPDQSDIRGMNGLQYLTALFGKEGASAEEHGCYVCHLEVEDIQRNSVIAYLLGAFAEYKASAPVKIDKTSSQEIHLANLLERTMNHILNQQSPRPLTKSRVRTPHNHIDSQGDLFSPSLLRN
jgi:phosphate starvation-inducible protein PhoH and related proteins